MRLIMPLSRRSPRNVRLGPSDCGASLVNGGTTTSGATAFASSSSSSFEARSRDDENDEVDDDDNRVEGTTTVEGHRKPFDETTQ